MGTTPIVEASSYTPAQEVIAIVELLEQILLDLPLEDLLRAQQINKHFESVTATSVELQRTLFFAPEPPTAYDLSAGIRLNPLLKRCFSRLPLPLWCDGSSLLVSQNPPSYDPAPESNILCPIHHLKITKVELTTARNDEWPTLCLSMRSDSWPSRKDLKAAMKGPWTGMYLAQLCNFKLKALVSGANRTWGFPSDDDWSLKFEASIDRAHTMEENFQSLSESVAS